MEMRVKYFVLSGGDVVAHVYLDEDTDTMTIFVTNPSINIEEGIKVVGYLNTEVTEEHFSRLKFIFEEFLEIRV